MTSLTASIDTDRAEAAACRKVLAYEIADACSEYADDSQQGQLDALAVLLITTAFISKHSSLTELQACAQFRDTFKTVAKVMRRMKSATLSDVVTELHLDQRRERKVRK